MKTHWNGFQQEVRRMLKGLNLWCIVFLWGSLLQGQQIPKNFSLYTDKKAKQVQDIITVLIWEDAKAKNDTRTQTDIDQEASFNLSPGKGSVAKYIPGVSAGYEQAANYDGRGKTSRSGSIKAKISARIIAVYDNGNLLVDGHKEVKINEEIEIIHVTGLIRPADILYDNTIYSYKLADAKIEYTGEGDSQNAHRPGFIARFINWIF